MHELSFIGGKTWEEDFMEERRHLNNLLRNDDFLELKTI